MKLPIATGLGAHAPSRESLMAQADALWAELHVLPEQPLQWQRLGLLCAQLGRHRDALSAFERAAAGGASLRVQAQAHALSLSALERHADAIAVLQPQLDKQAKNFDLTNLLGVLLKRAERLPEALKVLERASKLEPKQFRVWHNLGNVHEQMGNLAAAAAAFKAGLRLAPMNAELWRLHGRSLSLLGRSDEALLSLHKAYSLAPALAGALDSLLQALSQGGRTEEAEALLAQLLVRQPQHAEARVWQARLRLRAGDAPTARALIETLLAQQPGHLSANLLLAAVHGDGDRRSANAAYQRAVEAHPGDWRAAELWVDSLARSRYDSEAEHLERAYTAACALQDQHPQRRLQTARTLRTIFGRMLDLPRFAATGPLDSLLRHWQTEGRHAAVHYELGQVGGPEDRLRLVDWHRQWGRRVAAPLKPVPPLAMPALALGRKLRVGFMSSDLRDHPVTYFALPLLEGFDRDRVEVFCYSFFEGERTQAQAHLEQQVSGFRWWPKRSDDQVAEGIARDGLDMLFELGGSTAMNKLEVMARRPARIGASWLGYPHSAGLEAIDCILVDPYLKPEDPRLLIERPFEMPETWVAMGRMGFRPVPIEPGLPQDRAGHLSFGTANNPYKYTTACLDAWAEVLRQVPGSHFVFLRPEAATASFVRNARAAFAQRDVDPQRIDFVGVRGAHLPHYNRIDIALDSLPHVGGTTTCEALWMGVPTVSLVGAGFAERLSYSNLSNAGLGDLCAFSPQAYVQTAVCLAADPARRRQLRHGLRAQIAAHPLGQPGRFVDHFYGLAAKEAQQ